MNKLTDAAAAAAAAANRHLFRCPCGDIHRCPLTPADPAAL